MFSFLRMEVVSSYFECWRSHDLHLLETIFSDCKHYEIIPKAQILKDFGEIKSYWIRNSARQYGLEVSWQLKSCAGESVVCDFEARFLNSVNSQWQHIFGWIEFTINNKKIIRLVEDYKKEICDGNI